MEWAHINGSLETLERSCNGVKWHKLSEDKLFSNDCVQEFPKGSYNLRESTRAEVRDVKYYRILLTLLSATTTESVVCTVGERGGIFFFSVLGFKVLDDVFLTRRSKFCSRERVNILWVPDVLD
jgi:hypothetical protein